MIVEDLLYKKHPNSGEKNAPDKGGGSLPERREQMASKFEYRRSVTHRCGHTVKHTFHAHNRQEADSWAHNMRKADCPACRENYMSREKAVEEESRKENLPALRGSANQVAWAMAIRSRIYGVLSRSDRFHGAAHLCRLETMAQWWIEHRCDMLCEIVSHLRCLEKGSDVAA